MKKFYIISLLSVFLTTPAWAADTFICSYTAQISPQDKLNSSGNSIISITTHFINAINLIPKIAKHAPKPSAMTLNIFYKPVHFLHKASP